MPRLIIPNFNKGELSPELFGRVDIAAYQGGLATARNCIVHTYGGISRRPGTRYIAPVKDHSYTPKLKRFEFKTTDTYLLEFGDFYMRVFRRDAPVYDTSEQATITNATAANPVVITTSAAHGYSNGDEIVISDVVGMTELNDKRFVINNVTSTTFELTNKFTGLDIDGTSYTAYSSGGTVDIIFELVTPWAKEDVFDLNFSQSADTMTICHPDYLAYDLTRSDHDVWTLNAISVVAEDYPSDLSSVANTTGAVTVRYAVTATTEDSGIETLVGVRSTPLEITSITNTSPIVVTTSVSHGLIDNDEIQINNVSDIHRKRFIVRNTTVNTFELENHDGSQSDGTLFDTFNNDGFSNPMRVRVCFTEITDSAATYDNTITWNKRIGADFYSVYREEGTVGSRTYNWIGDTTNTTFTDEDITADDNITPPVYKDPFLGNNPGASGYYQQRKVLGGSNDFPDTSYFSRVNEISDFSVSFPFQDDDAITATLTSLEVNQIRHYIPLRDLLILTSGSEWSANRGFSDVFSPSTVVLEPQSKWGSSRIAPEIVGDVVIYLTDNDRDVRTLESPEPGFYTGVNLNILSRHLTDGYTISDWTYARYPDSRLYIVRSDGKALTLGYDKEQELIAWTIFDTDGYFESVEATRSGVDCVYWIIKRNIDGYENPVRYIEVLRQTFFDDIRDCFFVDSGLSLNNPIDIKNINLSDPVKITTVESHGLSDGDTIDIFDIIWENDIDAMYNESQPDQLNTKRYLIKNTTNNTFELTDLSSTNIDGSSYNAYVSGGTVRKAFTSVSGLEHLESNEVICLCDGNVIRGKIVSNGTVSFDRAFSRIHIGLPNIADIETLNIDDGQGQLQGIIKKVIKVVLRFFKSRGMFIGPDSFHLIEMKWRELEALADPTSYYTGDKEIIIPPSWNSNGRIFLRQPDPLPMTVLAAIPHFDVEDGI